MNQCQPRRICKWKCGDARVLHTWVTSLSRFLWCRSSCRRETSFNVAIHSSRSFRLYRKLLLISSPPNLQALPVTGPSICKQKVHPIIRPPLVSLRASSPGRENEIKLSFTSLEFGNLCIEKVDAKCWLAEITLVMTSLPFARVFQCLFTFALVSSSRWLAEIWQLSRRGATGKLEVELKFQRRSCKLSFIFPPRRPGPFWKLNENPVNVKRIKISTAIMLSICCQ